TKARAPPLSGRGCRCCAASWKMPIRAPSPPTPAPAPRRSRSSCPSCASACDAARFRLFDSVTIFLKRAAARRPLVVVLDDLHWADEASLRLLGFLAAALADCPILVLATYRDVEV